MQERGVWGHSSRGRYTSGVSEIIPALWDIQPEGGDKPRPWQALSLMGRSEPHPWGAQAVRRVAGDPG